MMPKLSTIWKATNNNNKIEDVEMIENAVNYGYVEETLCGYERRSWGNSLISRPITEEGINNLVWAKCFWCTDAVW